jgi:hypothetical protein
MSKEKVVKRPECGYQRVQKVAFDIGRAYKVCNHYRIAVRTTYTVSQDNGKELFTLCLCNEHCRAT